MDTFLVFKNIPWYMNLKSMLYYTVFRVFGILLISPLLMPNPCSVGLTCVEVGSFISQTRSLGYIRSAKSICQSHILLSPEMIFSNIKFGSKDIVEAR